MIRETGIGGCFLIDAKSFSDPRGALTVMLDGPFFAEHGLRTDFIYNYYSESVPGVLRGFHFQAPPHAQAKLVYCLSGSIIDAVLDIRESSPTYGKCILIPLEASRKLMIYIPEGLAHAFLSEGETRSVVYYHTTSPYSPGHEGGILWNSVGAEWPTNEPLMSEKDSAFPHLDTFVTPFRLEKNN